MFSGIVEDQGVVIRAERHRTVERLGIRFVHKKPRLEVGESIAVNGVCLTVVSADSSEFECDVVRETLKATTLGLLQVKDTVNLERSLRYGDRISGHYVSGHVDGRGAIEKIQQAGDSYLFFIRIPGDLMPFVAPKGSLAVDGISLTVQEIRASTVKIAVIPHTFRATSLGLHKKGDAVNLEVDMLARYPGQSSGSEFSGSKEKTALTLSYLRGQGF